MILVRINNSNAHNRSYLYARYFRYFKLEVEFWISNKTSKQEKIFLLFVQEILTLEIIGGNYSKAIKRIII